jgi:hydroxyethylthiazole kinase-like uncharacterized protein yjeF
MVRFSRHELPILLGDEARTIDLEVTEKVGRVRILESVATRIADLIHYHLPVDEMTPLLFIVGKGNNGANAMACARILHLRGFSNIQLVTLVDPADESLRLNVREQMDLFSHFVGDQNIKVMDWKMIQAHEGVIVDGIVGTGIADPPRGVSKDAIEAILASSNARVLSIDMPSGLNHVTGAAPGACVKATWTCNLHMLKSGQLEPIAREYVGELWSVESALGFITFPEPDKFKSFYKSGPIQKVEKKDS